MSYASMLALRAPCAICRATSLSLVSNAVARSAQRPFSVFAQRAPSPAVNLRNAKAQPLRDQWPSWGPLTNTTCRTFVPSTASAASRGKGTKKNRRGFDPAKPPPKIPARVPVAKRLPIVKAKDLEKPEKSEGLSSSPELIALEKEEAQSPDLPSGPLPESQVTKILGPNIESAVANGLFRVLQHRRTTGSLVEKGIAFPEGSGYEDREIVDKALSWLRDRFPIDEEAAAVNWLEVEADRIEHAKLRERSVKLKLWKSVDEPAPTVDLGHQVADSDKWRFGQTEHSVLEQIRANAKQEEAERKEKEKAELAKSGKDASSSSQSVALNEERPGFLDRVKNDYRAGGSKNQLELAKQFGEEAQIPVKELFAERSPMSRLLLPTIFGLMVIGLSIGFAVTYTPPSSDERIFPNVPPAAATLGAIIGLNCLVTILWKRTDLWRLFNRYMLLSAGAPRAFSLLGNLFSHQGTAHLAVNMATLYAAGYQLHEEIGRGNFIALYLTSGVFACMVSLWVNVLRKNFVLASLGASGAILGLVAARCLYNPSKELKIAWLKDYYPDFSIPLSSQLFLAILVAFGVVAYWREPAAAREKVNHLEHAVGMCVGAVGAYVLRWRAKLEKRDQIAVAQMHPPVEDVKSVDG